MVQHNTVLGSEQGVKHVPRKLRQHEGRRVNEVVVILQRGQLGQVLGPLSLLVQPAGRRLEVHCLARRGAHHEANGATEKQDHR